MQIFKSMLETSDLLITGSFLKGILDKDSFSIRPHTVEKYEKKKKASALTSSIMFLATDYRFVNDCGLTCWPH